MNLTPSNVVIGCCGWSYLEKDQYGGQGKRRPASKLEAYAQLFDAVEVNSTFYRIPRLATAEKWRVEASAANRRFIFTVKAYQGITHVTRFGKGAGEIFESVRGIAAELGAPVILFQSPASFRPTAANVRALTGFFGAVERGQCSLAWEPRGTWYDEPQAIVDVCEAGALVHCVDPLRNRPLTFTGTLAYFRLHGFGKPSMYNYDFSAESCGRSVRCSIRSLVH